MKKIENLCSEIKCCEVCSSHLLHRVNPVFDIAAENRVAIIGHAPGRKVHESGIPWQDASGDRLRSWLGVSKKQFYEDKIFAIVPMGFCYPGKGKSGDNPPRPECAPLWHEQIFRLLPNIKLTILIGQHAQKYYLGDRREKNLTTTVQNFEHYLPELLPLPHPSPRNNIWLKKNPWFEQKVLPNLLDTVRMAIKAKPL